MAGSDRLHPKPKVPLPDPESYASESCGPKPERPGLVASGTVIVPVPVTGLAANFSPMPRIAPPPLGSEITGAEEVFCPSAFRSGFLSWTMRFPRTIDGPCLVAGLPRRPGVRTGGRPPATSLDHNEADDHPPCG